jgi:transposase
MYIERVPNRNSRPAFLLRSAKREGKRVVKRTLANLSSWPPSKIEALRKLLADQQLVSPEDLFRVRSATPHGHVELLLKLLRKIGLDQLIGSRRSRERDLVVAMIVERLLHPASKLDTTRLLPSTTLAEELGLGEVHVDELYAVLDWLLARQDGIEKKLARRHIAEGSVVLYDVSSSFYYGRHCSLARFGHSRDAKKGLPIIVYGLLADAEGRPVSVQVYPGNTADPRTVPDQVVKLQQAFGVERAVLVGDRGMLTQAQIDALAAYPQLGWISCLRSTDIRRLVDEGTLQMSLFDQQNLAELTLGDDASGERLIACMNPLLAEERRRKREELLAMTERDLEKIARDIQRRSKTPLTATQIGLRVGRVLYHYKMGKHFAIDIDDNRLSWQRRTEEIEREAALDGIYVIRTSEPVERFSAEDAVRTYKSLANVERAFRCLKGVNNRIRPIYHRTEPHVRAHVFLCMLAYYLEWHLRRALAPLLYQDEDLPGLRSAREPVGPAQISARGRRKKAALKTDEGFPLHTLASLLELLGQRARVTLQVADDPESPAFDQLTEMTPLQTRCNELIDAFPVR